MAEKRIRHLETDLDADPPRTDILCKNCVYRQPGPYGFNNGHCQKYETTWKPSGILFLGQPCKFYKEEKAAAE